MNIFLKNIFPGISSQQSTFKDINTVSFVEVEPKVCLKFIPERMSLENAKKACKKDESDLIEPKTKSLDQTLENFASNMLR